MLGELLKKERRLGDACIGTVDGEIVVTLRKTHTTEASRKRKADTAAEGAARAVARVRKASRVREAALEAAEAALANLCRIKGLNSEEVVDAFAVSSRAIESAPAVVVGVRLAAGIAMPYRELLGAIEASEDGVVTVSAVEASFDLPLSKEATLAEEAGQKTLLIYLNFK